MWWGLAPVLTLASACTTVRPITHPSLVGREVEVTFMRPRDLELPTSAESRVFLEDLYAIRGRALWVSDNTLAVEVTWWRASGVWQYERRPVVASVHLLDSELSIGERRFSKEHTLLATAATVAVLWLVTYWLVLSGLGET